MYLLAPTAAASTGSAAGQSLLMRALSDELLVKWGAPGKPQKLQSADQCDLCSAQTANAAITVTITINARF